ncbi:MAG: carbohydrate kinase family protein [Anaerolineaceae bacterium]
MPDIPSSPLGAVFGGRLQRDYVLPFEGKERLNVLGGNLPYAAAGYALWGGKAGLVSRVNPDYPMEWLATLQGLDFDLNGVLQVREPIDARRFIAYTDPLTPHGENPMNYFAGRQIPFPLELLGYDSDPSRFCSKMEYDNFSVHVNDIPHMYLDVSAAHICPIDYLSHKIMPSILRVGMIQTLTMRACACYMDPSFWEDIRGLISDLTAFMITEAEALRLFQGRSVDLWEIAQALANYGPEFVLIHQPDGAAWLYDRLGSNRWIVPAYPTRVADLTGVLDAFDGAFLLNYRKDFDALEATLCGNITASICQEGFGPYYLLDTLPGLKKARLAALRPRVKKV